MNIGYVRVSAKDQNEEMQLMSMENMNIDKFYIDKKSGKNIDRKAFQEMMSFIRDGDTLFVYHYDRLARNALDALLTLKKLDEKGVELVCIKLNIDTRTPVGRAMYGMHAVFAEMFVNDLDEKRRDGIENARRRGVHMGRPWKETPKEFEKVYKSWKEGKITAKQAFTALGLTKNTFYNMVKAHEKGIDRKKLSKNYLKVI